MYILVCVSFFYQLNIHFRIRTLGNLKVTYSGHYSDNKKHLLFKILCVWLKNLRRHCVFFSPKINLSPLFLILWSNMRLLVLILGFVHNLCFYIRSWLNSYKTHTSSLAHKNERSASTGGLTNPVTPAKQTWSCRIQSNLLTINGHHEAGALCRDCDSWKLGCNRTIQVILLDKLRHYF